VTAGSTKAWLRAQWPLFALALAAGLPIVGSAIHAISAGWTPLGDNAFTAVRALDVLTSHTPLSGQWSSGATTALGEPVDSPGPMLFWLFAVPVRLPDARALPVTMAIVNLLCIAGALALARRRGGFALMLAVAAGVALTLASLPADAYTDVWNSSAPLMPLLLLTMLAWSVAAGEYPLLPATVLVGSFVAQAHLTFVAPAVCLLVAALTLLLWQLPRRRDELPQVRRWALAAVLVGALCWAPPIADAVVHEGGNPSRIVRSAQADVPKLGKAAGLRAVVSAVGIRPRWLDSPASFQEWRSDLLTSPDLVAAGSTVVLLAGLASALAFGLVRRRPDLAAAGGIGLALCVAIFLVAGSTPQTGLINVLYTLRWASVAGMVVWMAAGWAALSFASPRLRQRAARSGPVAAWAAAALVVAIGTVVLIRSDPLDQPYRETRVTADRLVDALPEKSTTRVEARITSALFMTAHLHGGLVYALRRAGRGVTIDENAALGFGRRYANRAHDHVAELIVDQPSSGKGRRVSLVRAFDPFENVTRSVEVRLASG